MKKGIEIKVLIYSESEMELKELNIKFNENKTENLIEVRTFWQIDIAMPNRENINETVFYSGGESYITPIKYKDFVELINNHNNKR